MGNSAMGVNGMGNPGMGMGNPGMGMGNPGMGMGNPAMGMGNPAMGMGSANPFIALQGMSGLPNAGIGPF